MKENSGGVLTRGYGLFSRILTRGFGEFFKTQAIPKKKKEPIYREYNFSIYAPIIKNIDINFIIKNTIKKIFYLDYLLKSNLLNEFNLYKKIKSPIIKNLEVNYVLNTKIDKTKIINTLNFLIEDD